MEGCEASFDADFAIDVADAVCDDFDVEPEGLYDDDGVDEGEAEAEGEAEDEGEADYERPRCPKRGRAKGRRPKRPSVKDHMRCSLFSVNCCNFLSLGFMALLCSLQVRKKMRKGDIEGARNCAGHACRTNIAAVLLTTCSAILMFILFHFKKKYVLNQMT